MTLTWAIKHATSNTNEIVGGKPAQQFQPIYELNPWIKTNLPVKKIEKKANKRVNKKVDDKLTVVDLLELEL